MRGASRLLTRSEVACGLFWADYGKRCISELIGTYALVVVGPSSVILLPKLSLSSTPEGLVLVALTFGLTVSAMIMLLGEHSGAVINPALALAATSARLLNRELLVPYILFQTAGGILAGLTLGFVFHPLGDSTNLGSTELAANISPVAGIALEALGTSILAASALAATSWIRRAELQAIAVGGTLTILIVLIGPLTGAGFNPARSLGPALASDYFSNFYVYVIGPVLGALIAGLLFRQIQSPRRFQGSR
ncbi:MAG TPA: aquaporin [Nitrososphaerales archaeon]|nr:aquaporin [Nitrososphaerales archaeon]